MSADGIFLKSGDRLTVLERRSYESEQLLQAALAEHPEVLAGPTTAGDEEARLLLVRREMPVPTVAGGSGKFSLDHLFLDGQGVPVFVEVKRSSDTRIRREVVGQMLDYAANAAEYWPVGALREAADESASSDAGKSADEFLAELDASLDPEDYWKTVEANLRAGRIRMIFVSDELPEGLVRVIEFLNEQMSPAEVLGVELRQYVGGQHTVYVPHLVGRTSAAVVQKTRGAGQPWDRESFLDAAEGRCSPAEVQLIHRLLRDVDTRGVKLSWGKGVTPGVTGWYSLAGRPTPLWMLNASSESRRRAYLQFYLADIVTQLGPDRVERAALILERIPSLKNKIAEARDADWKKYPSFYLADVARDDTLAQLVFDAIADLVRDSQAS